MPALLHTEFAALLARADLSQASFARLTGVTARQVNNWARGRAVVPRWAALLAIALLEQSSEALTITLEETSFSWHETLGVSPTADATAARRAMTRPVVVTRNGRPRNVLLSVAEYDRLKQRDQQVFLAADTPEPFLSAIEKLADGEA